jgi:hypothetical protein
MVRGYGYYLTSGTSVRNFLGKVFMGASGISRRWFVLPTSVWTLSTLTSDYSAPRDDEIWGLRSRAFSHVIRLAAVSGFDILGAWLTTN